MFALLINNNRSKWAILDELFGNTNPDKPSVFVGHNQRSAWNYLHGTGDIEMVFMGYHLDGGIDTISSGLVQAYVDHGFGHGGKPLIAASSNRNRQLMEAGCSFQTSLTNNQSLRSVLRQITEEREFVNQMLRTG